MNTLKNIPVIAAAAALAATTIALTAGLAPASAAPTQTPGTTLEVVPDPVNAGHHRVAVRGVFPMNEYDAHGFINNLGTGTSPGGMDYRLFGDDPGSNDAQIGNTFAYRAPFPSTGYLHAEADGIHFGQLISVPDSLLNEDVGAFDNIDEVYVEADFVDGDGGKRTAITNPDTGVYFPLAQG
jgi:hypothetical protein